MAAALRARQSTSAALPPLVERLRHVFNNLPDSELVEYIGGPVRRGPKGYPVRVLWQCFVAKYVMGEASTASLIRTFENNPWIAEMCGLNWPDIPHEATFSRFFAKLAKRFAVPRVKDVSRKLVRLCRDTIPGFSSKVAIDSTTLKGWSNPNRVKVSDKQAGWSVKKNSRGSLSYTYGWKLHLAVDTETELPISAKVTAGNINDSKVMSNVLSEARLSLPQFRPQFIIADAGYSSLSNLILAHRQYRAEPVIDINPGHKSLLKRTAGRRKQDWYQAIRKQRPAVERAFSRLKHGSLDKITVRGRPKVTVHCYLAMIALQAVAVPISGS